ncbi:DUF6875 domain-containing protein [Burkholderia ubonensis]|uniref:DUF6875 domain-containing protein n=1 Tax=Burkholderia ubonensis TaxID=101571 RepID=UPI0018DF5694|nr:hypothetical protein [Burkholderia ubonensis]
MMTDIFTRDSCTMDNRVFVGTFLSFSEAEENNQLRPITAWVREFLCKPHTDVGRDGDVCPFTRTSISKDSFQFSINYSETEQDFSSEVEAHMTEFMLSGGTKDIYRCRLIVPVALRQSSAAIVGATQKKLKPEFVARHLMIGQFFPGCAEQALWNENFFPLQSPVPLIAIRNMVPTDVAFLYDNEEFMDVYRTRFGDRAERAIRQYETARGIVA